MQRMIIFLSLAFLAVTAQAQKDFDCRFTTTKMLTNYSPGEQSRETTCTVSKTGKTLNVERGGNKLVYALEFLGVSKSDTGAQVLIYAITDDAGNSFSGQFIYIDPFLPRVIVSISGRVMILE